MIVKCWKIEGYDIDENIITLTRLNEAFNTDGHVSFDAHFKCTRNVQTSQHVFKKSCSTSVFAVASQFIKWMESFSLVLT